MLVVIEQKNINKNSVKNYLTSIFNLLMKQMNENNLVSIKFNNSVYIFSIFIEFNI